MIAADLINVGEQAINRYLDRNGCPDDTSVQQISDYVFEPLKDNALVPDDNDAAFEPVTIQQKVGAKAAILKELESLKKEK